jgi:hypothetical protein
MAKKTLPLSDVQVRNAKPKDGKTTKVFDGDGLFLLVSAGGSKGWRFKYKIRGKEKLMSFGTYPEISLSQAREKRSKARKLIGNGISLLKGIAEQGSFLHAIRIANVMTYFVECVKEIKPLLKC